MTYPKEGVSPRVSYRIAEDFQRVEKSPKLEAVPIPSPQSSVLYRGGLLSFPEEEDQFIPPQLVYVDKASSKDALSDNSIWGNQIDAWDILAWTLSLGAGVAAGFLIDKGLREDSTPYLATGEALATSSFMWGVFEASFRGSGIPHDKRWLRFGIAAGAGVVTGLAVNYGSMKFDFDVAKHRYQDDVNPFVAVFQNNPQLIKVIQLKIPNIKFFQATYKNPTSEWGP